jgi:hypothetical protein
MGKSRIRDSKKSEPGTQNLFDIGSGMEKFGSGTRNKDPGPGRVTFNSSKLQYRMFTTYHNENEKNFNRFFTFIIDVVDFSSFKPIIVETGALTTSWNI